MNNQAINPDISEINTPWSDIPIPAGYELACDGVFKTQEGDKHTRVFISAPLWLKAITIDLQTNEYGMLLCWRDLDGNIREQIFEYGLLQDQRNALSRTLSNLGLFMNPRMRTNLKEYINESMGICKARIRSVSALGWVNDESDLSQLTYILPPDLVFSKTDENKVVFKPVTYSPTSKTIRTGSYFQNWHQKVVNPCIGNPILIFALCVPFAAPLLKLAKIDSFGFHLHGRSSRGKTTAAQVVASIFGCAADPADSPDQSSIQRWNSTQNAFEGLAAAHNDGVLVLDELHTCDAKDFAKVIYDLFGGKGKSRLSKDADLKKHSTWRTIVFSTGEISAKRKVEASGQQSLAGQRIRLLDIPLDEKDGIVQSSNFKSKNDFVMQLKTACSKYYGHAGPLFIRYIVDQFENSHAARQVIEHRLKEILDDLSSDTLLPEQKRALQRFSLVKLAGYMAIEANLLDIPKSEIDKAIKYVTKAWLNDESNIPDHISGAIKIQDFVERHQSRLIALDSANPCASPPRDVVGYRNYATTMLTREGLNEALGDIDTGTVLKYIKSLSMLEHDSDRLFKKVSIEGTNRPRLCVIKQPFFEVDFIKSPEATTIE